MTDTQTQTTQGATAAQAIIAQMKEVVEIKESFKEDQVKFIKNLINPDLTDNELYMFLMYSQRAGLNPFNKEIIAVVYNGQQGRVVNTIVTRDGKRAAGYRKGGIESIVTGPIYTKTMNVPTGQRNEKGEEITEAMTVRVQPWEGGTLWGATSTVKRGGKEFTATVPLKEYNTGRNVWAGKPETMIKKVAESQALSMAVPELLGIYDEAEMPPKMIETATVAIENGQETANAELLETLKVLGADMGRTYTKQEATDTILALQREKAKKKVKKEEDKTALSQGTNE